MDPKQPRLTFAELELKLAPVRAAFREWRTAYEAEAREAFAGLDEDTRMKVVFHVFRVLARDVGSYRYLIYDKLGFDMDAYAVLTDGLAINNALVTDRDRPQGLAESDQTVEEATSALAEYRRDGGEDAEAWFAGQEAAPPADDPSHKG